MSTAVLTAVAWAYRNGARPIGHKSGSGVASGVFARCHWIAGNRVLMTPESVPPSITTASRRSATGTTSSRSTWGHGLKLLLAHDAGTADQHDDRPVQAQPGAVERGRDLVGTGDPDAGGLDVARLVVH